MIGGVAGTAVMGVYRRATMRLGAPGSASSPRQREHDISLVGRQHAEGESATSALARIVYYKVKGADPDPPTKSKLSQAIHWAYGIEMGGAYGLLHNGAGVLAGGVAFGAALWLLGDEIGVPLLGLAEGPKAFPVSLHVETFGAHIAYGLAAAAATELVERVL
jgi:hypothetical protein